jgi:hypothetical protein
MPSPGKARLQDALEGAGLVVSSSGTVRVHAETDLEALLDPGLMRATRAEAAKADIVIPVDWESAEDSVRRVIAVLSRLAPSERTPVKAPALSERERVEG